MNCLFSLCILLQVDAVEASVRSLREFDDRAPTSFLLSGTIQAERIPSGRPSFSQTFTYRIRRDGDRWHALIKSQSGMESTNQGIEISLTPGRALMLYFPDTPGAKASYVFFGSTIGLEQLSWLNALGCIEPAGRLQGIWPDRMSDVAAQHRDKVEVDASGKSFQLRCDRGSFGWKVSDLGKLSEFSYKRVVGDLVNVNGKLQPIRKDSGFVEMNRTATFEAGFIRSRIQSRFAEYSEEGVSVNEYQLLPLPDADRDFSVKTEVPNGTPVQHSMGETRNQDYEWHNGAPRKRFSRQFVSSVPNLPPPPPSASAWPIALAAVLAAIVLAGLLWWLNRSRPGSRAS